MNVQMYLTFTNCGEKDVLYVAMFKTL